MIENKQTRNELGLLDSVSYVFNENSTVNWRKMIKPEYLAANKKKTEESDTSKLKDSELLILLQGLKDLAQLRGYTSVKYEFGSARRDYCAVRCGILWIPNYETNFKEVYFESIGDAHSENTEGFSSNYLGPIAENRAFVRCVRNFLGINIVSQEEISGNHTSSPGEAESETVPTPQKCLEELMVVHNLTLEKVLDKLKAEGHKKVEEYKSVSDIPIIKVLELVSRLKKKKSKSND